MQRGHLRPLFTGRRSRAYRIRGDIRLTAGAADEAIRDFTDALTLDPAQPAILAGRANALLIKANRQRRVGSRLLPSALHRTLPSIGILAATLASFSVQPEPAIADFSEAIRLAPRAVSPETPRARAHET